MGSGLYFFILSIKIIPRDSKNTRASQCQSPALVHQGTVQGPIIVPYNSLTFCRLGVYRWPFSYLQTDKISGFDEEGGAMILTFVTTPTQPQLNSKVGCDMKMTLIHHPPTTTHPRKLNVSNISAVTGLLLVKL